MKTLPSLGLSVEFNDTLSTTLSCLMLKNALQNAIVFSWILTRPQKGN